MNTLKMIKANAVDLLNIASWVAAAGGVIAATCDCDKTAGVFVMVSMVAHYNARQAARVEVLNKAAAAAAVVDNMAAKFKEGKSDEVVLTPEEKIETIILAIIADPSYMPDESWLELANSLNPDDTVQSYRTWCAQEELTNRLYDVMHPECVS